jgi:hypothetical protein
MKKKVTILLPTHYNDGSVVEEYKLENALNRIADIGGGYTLDGVVCGAWRNPETGDIKKETMQKVWVVVNDAMVAPIFAFRRLAGEFATYFNQECIYFEVEDVDVQFISRG